MKIGIYDPYLDTLSGGEKYMLSIALCLSMEHEVVIFWDKAKEQEIRSKAKERFGFDLEKITFASSLFSESVSFLTRYNKSKDYDLLFYLSDGSLPIVASDLIVHFQSPMLWIKGRSLKNRLKMRRIKTVICNSSFTKSYVDKIFGIESKIVYPPVSIQGSYQPAKKERIILNVGRFGINWAGSSYKKQDVLAEAFAKLYTDGLKGWKLVFVMNVKDDALQAVDDLKNKYKDTPIEFVLNPPNSDLWKWYEKATFYWHAAGFAEDLTTHPDRAEHFGMTTVEAMGVGAVPLVVGTGGQKEIIEDGRNGRAWATIDELISYTKELITDDKERQKMAHEAVISADQYSLAHFNKRIKDLIT